MATTYTYSIQNDFPNQAISSDRLVIEIQQSAITIALGGVTTIGDVVQVTFKSSLSAGEITILNGIITVHSGDPIETTILGDATVVNGYTSTSNTNRTNIFATSYTEQLVNSQRALVSTSANDASGSIGAITAQVAYYDQTMAGPFVETITLNGTTPVNTVSTTVCFVESIKVVTAGSAGNNAGTINMTISAGGLGGTLCSIATNDNQTNLCQHYVGLGKTFFLTQVTCGNQGISNGNLTVLITSPTLSGTVDRVVIPQIRIPAGSTKDINFSIPIKVSGPARVLLQIKQDASAGTNNWFGSFSYQEI